MLVTALMWRRTAPLSRQAEGPQIRIIRLASLSVGRISKKLLEQLRDQVTPIVRLASDIGNRSKLGGEDWQNNFNRLPIPGFANQKILGLASPHRHRGNS